MICVTCRFCQDHQLPHVCVTRGGSLDMLRSHALAFGLADELNAVSEQLQEHPARPLGDWSPTWMATNAPPLRPLDWTWCDCGCRVTAFDIAEHGGEPAAAG